MNFKEIGDRFSKYMKIKDIRNKDVAENLKFSASQVTNIIQGKVFGSDKLFKILNYYTDLDANWLINNEGEMIKKKKEKEYIEENPNNIAKKMSELEYSLKFLNLFVSESFHTLYEHFGLEDIDINKIEENIRNS